MFWYYPTCSELGNVKKSVIERFVGNLGGGSKMAQSDVQHEFFNLLRPCEAGTIHFMDLMLMFICSLVTITYKINKKYQIDCPPGKRDPPKKGSSHKNVIKLTNFMEQYLNAATWYELLVFSMQKGMFQSYKKCMFHFVFLTS